MGQHQFPARSSGAIIPPCTTQYLLENFRDEQFIASDFKEIKPKWKGLGKRKSLCVYTIVLNMNSHTIIK